MNPWNPRLGSRNHVAVVVAADATAAMPPCGTRETSLEAGDASCVGHRPNHWHGIPKMPRRALQASNEDLRMVEAHICELLCLSLLPFHIQGVEMYLFGKQLEVHGWMKCPVNQIQASSRIRTESSSYGDP